MDPELTINLEVNEMNVDKEKNADHIEDIDKKEDKTEKILDNIVTKTEDGDKSTVANIVTQTEVEDKSPKKIEKDVESIDSSVKSKTESIVPELPEIKKVEVKYNRTDIIPTKKVLVEKKPSKFKLWFLRTFFFKKFNKLKIDSKRKTQGLTVTESGVERSTSVTSSASSSSSSPSSPISKDKQNDQCKVCGIID